MKKTRILLLAIILATYILLTHMRSEVPPCLNADEASYGYNAYSIAKTLRDEYGNFIPLRLRSFDDYKLPLYAYGSIPFIAFFSNTDQSVRMLNIIVSLGVVIMMYRVAYIFFIRRKTALIVAFFTGTSTWLAFLGRQAHEGLLTLFFVLVSLEFLVKYLNKDCARKYLFGSLFASLIATFGYHWGRIFLIFSSCVVFFEEIRRRGSGIFACKNTTAYSLAGLIVIIPFLIDYLWGASRVSNLLFYKNIGFTLRINEYMHEHPFRLLHNKVVESFKDVSIRYFDQFSPQFLMHTGDTNMRFGFEGVGYITPFLLILTFVGLYYLFRYAHPHRYLLLLFLLIGPLGNAFTWQEVSLVRSYMIFAPLTLIASYGFTKMIQKTTVSFFNPVTLVVVGGLAVHFFFLILSWDMYLYHYPKRAHVQRSWQCGYEELSMYLEQNDNRFDNFYITSKHGQPYIFLVYYLKIDPSVLWDTRVLSDPDEYGFTQVESFGKYTFSIPSDRFEGRTATIGYPDDFSPDIDGRPSRKILYDDKEIFWVYENDGPTRIKL